MKIVRVLFTAFAVSVLAAMAGCTEPQAFQAPEPLRLHDVAYADVM